MPISKSTERIWKRLNRDLTGKPSYRANKTGSSRRFIPKERCTNPDTLSFITELLPSEDKVLSTKYHLHTELRASGPLRL